MIPYCCEEPQQNAITYLDANGKQRCVGTSLLKSTQCEPRALHGVMISWCILSCRVLECLACIVCFLDVHNCAIVPAGATRRNLESLFSPSVEVQRVPLLPRVIRRMIGSLTIWTVSLLLPLMITMKMCTTQTMMWLNTCIFWGVRNGCDVALACPPSLWDVSGLVNGSPNPNAA